MRDEAIISEFLGLEHFAIFGACEDRGKIGYKILKRLARAGYQVYPINPRVAAIGPMRCYGNLDDTPEIPQVIVVALPPEYVMPVLQSAADHGVRRVWIQPGSESNDALTYASENGFSTVVDKCLYERLGKR